MITFYIQVINNLGVFNCVMLEVSNIEFEKFKNDLKLIYQEEVFESELDDGNHIFMSNEMIKKSIFKLILRH